MTFNTALAEDILANLPKAPNISRPRCMCHNKYIQDCPNSSPRETELKTEISNQLASLDQIKASPSPEKCKKHGHKSRGKAEAQLRSLLRRQLETNSKGDASTLEVYKCRRVECKAHPWHVGHNPYVRREA